jgi:hypothetical protein
VNGSYGPEAIGFARYDGVAWLTGARGMERFQVAFAKSVRDWIAHPSPESLAEAP